MKQENKIKIKIDKNNNDEELPFPKNKIPTPINQVK